MNDMTVSNQAGAVEVYEEDGFDIAARATSSDIVGKILKFTKGDYTVDKAFLPTGLKLVAHMDSWVLGWIRWADGKPADRVFGSKKSNYQPQARDTLGFTDQNDWPLGQDGKPSDPWVLTHYVVFKEVDGTQLYTFQANSKGTRDALDELLKVYVQWRRMHPHEWPIVELIGGSHGYPHPKKELGFIKTPLFKIVGGESKSLFPDPKTGEVTESDDLLKVGRGDGASHTAASGAPRF